MNPSTLAEVLSLSGTMDYAHILVRCYLNRAGAAMADQLPLVRQWILLRKLCSHHYGLNNCLPRSRSGWPYGFATTGNRGRLGDRTKENCHDAMPDRLCRRLQEVYGIRNLPVKGVIGNYRKQEETPAERQVRAERK